jgi:hypothetical protein
MRTASGLLLAASTDPAVVEIVVAKNLADVPTFRLSPGQALKGGGQSTRVQFAPAQNGVQLSSDNRIESLELRADVGRRALFNDARVKGLGRLIQRESGYG